MRAWALVAFVTAVSLPVVVSAATFCVPHGAIGGSCSDAAPTIQAAIDAAPTGSYIRIGPGTVPERFVVDKRLTIQCLPGAILTDADLPTGGTMIEYVGTYNSPRLVQCDVQVATSDVGLSIPFSVGFFTMDKSSLTRVGPRAGTGLLVDGRDSPPKPAKFAHAQRVSLKATTVSGFDVCGDVYDAAWFNPESLHPSRPLWKDCNVGLRVTNVSGQIFYNTFLGNDVGLYVRAINTPVVGQIDINSNIFGAPDVPADANAVAVLIEACSMWHNEFNHNRIYESPVAFRVETASGEFVDGDRAYTEALVLAAQFADTLVCRDGTCTTYDTAAFSPTPTPSCFP